MGTSVYRSDVRDRLVDMWQTWTIELLSNPLSRVQQLSTSLPVDSSAYLFTRQRRAALYIAYVYMVYIPIRCNIITKALWETSFPCLMTTLLSAATLLFKDE